MADLLIRKGKRGTAAYIKTAVTNEPSNVGILYEVLDLWLDPTLPLDWDSIDGCRWIISGGKTPDEFAQIVRKYDSATTCGLVWVANFVAYRCRTCCISPCMSLCSDCFQRGNHEGHDYNMFRSQAGGACDCGDPSVLKESGFCYKHGLRNKLLKPDPPPDLLTIAKLFMPRAFLRLVQHLRDCCKSVTEKNAKILSEADGLLSLLHQHGEMGAAMRQIMTDALINPEIYNNLALNCKSEMQKLRPELVEYLTQNLNTLIKALYPSENSNSNSSELDVYLRTFLDELVFWTIQFEFPQKLVCMLLNMMPDLNYKEAFTKTFVQQYSSIGKMLAKSSDTDTLSNRVVHVSVQLFSNENLAYQMIKEYSLLDIMVKSLTDMISNISKPSILQRTPKDVHMVVDCSHRVMKENCYWPLVSDLNNILTHKPVAMAFVGDRNLLHKWFLFLSYLQGIIHLLFSHIV